MSDESKLKTYYFKYYKNKYEITYNVCTEDNRHSYYMERINGKITDEDLKSKRFPEQKKRRKNF